MAKTKRDIIDEMLEEYREFELDPSELETKKIAELEEMKEELNRERQAKEEESEDEGAEDEESDVVLGNDGEELLFPDGPSVSKLEEWKSQFNDEIYVTEFDEEVFLWRPIKRKEYKDIMKTPQADQYYKEERMCERVVLWPENYNFMAMTTGKAGIPTLLSEFIMEKSGFQPKTGALRV